MTDPKKFHFFLFTGEVVYRHSETEEVGALRLNAVIAGEEEAGPVVPVALLGQAQQGMIRTFATRMQSDKIEILDYVCLNVAHLGLMTKEQFEALPAENAKPTNTKPRLSVVPQAASNDDGPNSNPTQG